MSYTKEDILEYIRDEDVKFIRLAFSDAFGVQKNIAILASELETAFKYGVPFDATEILGFSGDEERDLVLFPIADTLSVLPWRPSHGRVVRFFCEIRYADGRPYERHGRAILENAVEYAKERGYTCEIGSEFEFYLFKTDEDGNATDIPYDNAGYLDIAPLDKGENVRREICLTLEDMGIIPESSHHEAGPGQNEVVFKHSSALTAADNAQTFKSVVRTVAARNGLYADFSPKPIENEGGNGLHINIVLKTIDGGKAATDSFAEGIMRNIKNITVFLNPLKESYKRLGEKNAPKYITWSRENRSQLVKLLNRNDGFEQVEIRSADTCTNPYIAFALLIYAGISGIEQKLKLRPAVNIDPMKAPDTEKFKFDLLPNTLEEAVECAGRSDIVLNNIPYNILNVYNISKL